MNKWQKIYCETYYGGKMPKTKHGKWAMNILSQIGNGITVHFPDFNGIHGFKPAHVETYIVTENELDLPNGKISVTNLVSNLELWISRGYKIETF